MYYRPSAHCEVSDSYSRPTDKSPTSQDVGECEVRQLRVMGQYPIAESIIEEKS